MYSYKFVSRFIWSKALKSWMTHLCLTCYQQSDCDTTFRYLLREMEIKKGRGREKGKEEKEKEKEKESY